MTVRVGIIGGSGLYEMEGLEVLGEERVTTPFGDPSDAFVIGRLPGDENAGVELVFLPRHGRGHRLTPSEVPYRANIWAMRQLGVEWVISVSAVGSLKREIEPGHVVIVEQFIDRTKDRVSTFFGDGVVAHVAFGDPVCLALRSGLLRSAKEAGAVVHDTGTYVCMEGPAFSTRAESNLYRSWGADVIGMTNLPEAKLAREAELSYATVALATDYDCWYEGFEDVTVEAVMAIVRSNAEMARQIIRRTIPRIAAWEGPAPMSSALSGAIMTDPATIPAETRERLGLLIDRYLE